MGMDPVQLDEVYEVTVQLEGPIGAQAFDDYQTALDKFIHDARKIDDADHPTGTPPKPKKLKVRANKSGVRPKSQ